MKTGSVIRRDFLKGGLLSACSTAVYPWLSTITLAAAPWDARMVVIILRGAMDGLDVVQPYGDPLMATYRPTLSVGPQVGTLDLDGFFGLNSKLAGLKPLWDKGELGFAHAVSTPYRGKRSHFDGQDFLEAGTGMDGAIGAQQDGWLNRLLTAVPGTEAETAFAIGNDDMRILNGTAPTMRWSPDASLNLSPQAQLLLKQVYMPDPLFAPAVAEAMDLATKIDHEAPSALKSGENREPLAAFVADRLNQATRIASYSLIGWDTHRGQKNTLNTAMNTLERSILTLKEGLGRNWSKTVVLAMTEFGRTVAENGSGGTDHGTGGAVVMAGGALRGGKVYGDWPGLDEAALYQRRDLMPTGDVRAYAAWAMYGLFGIDRATLQEKVFPSLEMGANPQLLL